MAGAERTPETARDVPGRAHLARLVLAEGTSVVGDWVLITAASIAVFRNTDSTVAVSVLLALVALPTILLGPIAGAMADRFDRRKLMIGADLLTAIVLVVGIALSALGLTLATVYGAVVVVNILATFHRPASEALLPAVAGDDNLGRANSMLRMSTRLAMIFGPALGSVFMSAGGFRLVLGVDAASFVVSALLVAGISVTATVESEERPQSPLRASIAAFGYARRHPRVRTVIGAIGVTMLVAQIVNAGTLALVSDALSLPSDRYGELLAAEGAGALLLALVLTWIGARLPLLPAGAAGLLLTGASTVLLGLAPGLVVALAAMVLMGMGVVGLQVAFTSYLQRETVDAFRGRVMSLVSIVASAGAILGLTATGPFVYIFGVRAAFVLAGAVICLSALPVLALLRFPAVSSAGDKVTPPA
jgi:MFS family permease